MAQATVATTVTGLQGHPVSNTAPTSGQSLTWNGSAWAPAGPYLALGGGTMTGTLTLPNVAGALQLGTGGVAGFGAVPSNAQGGQVLATTSGSVAGFSGAGAMVLSQGMYQTSTGGVSYLLTTSNPVGTLQIVNGTLAFYSAGAGSAGGAVTLNQRLVVDPNGNLTTTATARAGVFNAGTQGSVTGSLVLSSGTGQFISQRADSNFWFLTNQSGSQMMWCDVNGNLYCIQGWKPGGGTWADSSDERIKTVSGAYTKSLAALVQLQPQEFTYKGNDTMFAPAEGETAPYKESGHYSVAAENKTFAGLVAQAVETVFPECVESVPGWIDNVEVQDLRTLDTSPLIFAVINALSEISARLTALDGKQPA